MRDFFELILFSTFIIYLFFDHETNFVIRNTQRVIYKISLFLSKQNCIIFMSYFITNTFGIINLRETGSNLIFTVQKNQGYKVVVSCTCFRETGPGHRRVAVGCNCDGKFNLKCCICNQKKLTLVEVEAYFGFRLGMVVERGWDLYHKLVEAEASDNGQHFVKLRLGELVLDSSLIQPLVEPAFWLQLLRQELQKKNCL